MKAITYHGLVSAAVVASMNAVDKSASATTGPVVAQLWPPSDGSVRPSEALARVLAVGVMTDGD